MGIGPLIAWRKTSVRSLMRALAWPIAAAVATLEELAAAADDASAAQLPPTMEWPTMQVPATPTVPLRHTPAHQAPIARTAPYGMPVVEGKRSVRVDAERLDSLMTLIGELVIARGRLTELARQACDQALIETVSHASRLIGSLRDEITRSRMVPVGQAFERFERLVRDTSHELGKAVEFDLSGTDIEVDKSVLDEIGDPVIHLLRNALDHGVETASERRKSGKNAIARLTLSAERERAEVVIHVTDDGRGIDRSKVLANALSAGYVSPIQTDLTDAQLLELIARPGFSTTSSVTSLSGRGVGLDVVATKVRSLGGAMELTSAIGEGTMITIRLPMTLAIIHALLARTAGDIYALPITHVVETMVFSPGMSSYEDGLEVLSIRGEKLPAVRLRARLGHPLRDGGAGHVVVLDLPERRISLVVDELIGQQEIVVKPFDAARGMPQMFSGATILSTGAPALILDARAVA